MYLHRLCLFTLAAALAGTMFAVGRNLLSIRTNCMATQNL
jgi:hypothetical protein